MVSVAIPAYKPDFLFDAIKSVLAQSFTDLEIIVVDDYSPNNISDIVSNFSDERIRYFRNISNIGVSDPSKNWNVCLQYARGEFFCLLCDDDMYEPTFIQEMVKLAEDHPKCNVFRARAKIINQEGHTIDYYPSSPLFESCSDYIWHVGRKLRKQTISEWMLRTGHAKKCGGYSNLPFAWGSDYLSIYKFSIDGGIVSTTIPLVSYRRSKLNISSLANKDSEQKMIANKLFENEVLKLIKDNKMSESLCIEVFRHKILADEYILTHVNLLCFIRFLIRKTEFHINKKAFFKAILNKTIQIIH